nr:MAG: DNA pilot protein [Microvirus sp.]
MALAPWIGPAIAAGGSIIGGLLGQSGVRSQNAANAREAQKNRDFQERMSGSSHQRSVTDLRAAGLNPILSATKGGASTPGGAQAQMQSELEPLANSARDSMQSVAQIKLMTAQADKLEKEADVIAPKANINSKLDQVLDYGLDTASGLIDFITNPGTAWENMKRDKAKKIQKGLMEGMEKRPLSNKSHPDRPKQYDNNFGKMPLSLNNKKATSESKKKTMKWSKKHQKWIKI